jgi:eukaryotic-like serine/threonine-protein kinase
MDHRDRNPLADPTDKRSGSRWDRLDELFDEASSLPEAERETYLARACGDEPALRAEVFSLLRHSYSGDLFLSSDSVGSFSAGRPGAGHGTASIDALVGRMVGNYRIEAHVGSGGMGVVYRAWDTRLDRPVALKFVWPALSTNPVVKERFLVEARAAAGLDHPNICTVHEVGETDDGALFMAMAYYEGETLKQRLARGPLPIEEAVDAIIQTAQGVSAAHSRGIVHRDLKPGNILITRGGVAKLLDFGIAKDGQSSITDPGSAMGTAAYMSPELFRGESADLRSDLWSLGVVLYELLAARRPFDGDTPAGTLHAVLYEDPVPLAEARPDVPPALEAAIRRALARDPGRRQPSADELIADIRTALERSGRQHRASQSRHRRPLVGRRAAWASIAVLAAAIIFVIASGTFAWDRATAGATAPAPFSGSASGTGVGTGEAGATVAVLAFEDQSPGAHRTWFADGISEEIRDRLARIAGLRVTGAQSSFAYRGIPPDARQAGSTLGARHLLVGTLRRAGDSIWITPRLLDTATDSELWSRTYGPVSDPSSLLEVQSEVTNEVARALELRLRPGLGRDRGAPDAAAYDAYLEGRFHLRRFQAGATGWRGELVQSVGHFRAAVARSPEWASAWAALGEALHWVATHGSEHGNDPETHFPESKAALERALDLDPGHALAHASMGYVLHRWNLDHAGAESYFRRALELDPDQYWHCGYGLFLLWSERYEEAVRAFQRAEAQDPLYLLIKDFLGASYRCAGRYQEAIASAEAVLAENPLSPSARRDLVLALAANGRMEEALARLDEVQAPHPYWDLVRALLYGRGDRQPEAEALLRGLDEGSLAAEMLRLYPSRRVSSVPIHAAALVALGRPEAAIDILSTAVGRDPWVLLYDRCYSELDALAADPRYQEIVRRTGSPGLRAADRDPGPR